MLAKAVGVNDRLRRTEGKNRLLPGAERENRPLPCSDRAGGRACRERLFRQLGRCLVYAPLIPFDLSAEAVAVSGGELFAKVLNSSASNDPPSFNERYEWAFGGQYDGGTAYRRLDSVFGQLSEDLHFRTFVNPSHVEVVAIDVMPDDDTNFIAPRSRGVIPVSILTTDTLDATTVEQAEGKTVHVYYFGDRGRYFRTVKENARQTRESISKFIRSEGEKAETHNEGVEPAGCVFGC
jgi:hypothetical protein